MKDTWARNEISNIWSGLNNKLGRTIFIRRHKKLPSYTFSGGVCSPEYFGEEAVDIAELLEAILDHLNLDVVDISSSRKFKLVERNKE